MGGMRMLKIPNISDRFIFIMKEYGDCGECDECGKEMFN
jgi:hypothetical protein